MRISDWSSDVCSSDLVCADLFEVDRNRCTCSGGTAALDMMLYLIQQQHGSALATKVSEQCLVDRIRNPHDRPRLPLRARLGVHNPKLIAAIELMEANLSEPLEQDPLANYIEIGKAAWRARGCPYEEIQGVAV